MLIFDIETDNVDVLKVSKIHVISIYDTEKKQFENYEKEDVDKGIQRLNGEVVAGHNIVKYDVPVLQRFYDFTPKKMVDTLIWTRLVFPDIQKKDMYRKGLPKKLRGSHSLEAWGYRLGNLKGSFGKSTDWSTWSKEMTDYCQQDVEVTKDLLKILVKQKVSKEALRLEHDVARIIGRQERYGFYFDEESAEKLYVEIKKKQEEVLEKLQEKFPPKKKTVGYYKRDNKKRGIKKGDPKIKIEEFNPNSPKMRAERLQELGWKPEEYTPTGMPKTSESILEKLPYEEAQLMVYYMMLSKRLGQIGDGKSSWLKLVYPDGRIRGHVRTNGTITGRMTHNSPNVAQVPANDVEYGKECRSLFTVPEGYKLVGCDASGLELRCLAHYLSEYTGIDNDYIQEILHGDIHTKNQKAVGLPERKLAKRFIYAFLYGGGDRTLGAIQTTKEIKKLFKKDIDKFKKDPMRNIDKYEVIGGIENYSKKHLKEILDTSYSYKKVASQFKKIINDYYRHLYDVTKGKVSDDQGKVLKVDFEGMLQAMRGYVLRKRFYKKVPGLREFQDSVEQEAKNGEIEGFDGRTLKVREVRSAVNLLLQSAGAIIMKKALVNLDASLQNKGYTPGKDFEFVGNIHDEYQIEVKEEYAEDIAKEAEQAIRDVDANVPLDGEAEIGDNWSETH